MHAYIQSYHTNYHLISKGIGSTMLLVRRLVLYIDVLELFYNVYIPSIFFLNLHTRKFT